MQKSLGVSADGTHEKTEGPERGVLRRLCIYCSIHLEGSSAFPALPDSSFQPQQHLQREGFSPAPTPAQSGLPATPSPPLSLVLLQGIIPSCHDRITCVLGGVVTDSPAGV